MTTQIDKIIQSRKTQKILSWNKIHTKNHTETIKELLELASTAPFHFPCNSQYQEKNKPSSIVPWRIKILNEETSEKLRKYFKDNSIEGGKIYDMLGIASNVLLVYWLPEENTSDNLFSGTQKNMEHIAATSSAIQNILLWATARNIPNYWSSGWILKEKEIQKLFWIPETHILLWSIFLFESIDMTDNPKIISGELHNKWENYQDWSEYIEM